MIPADAPPLVGFLIAGVQKGGTTALFEHLREIAGLQLPSSLKEAHFFDDEGVDWADPDASAYHALFDPGRPGLCGEATPIYSYWPNSLERIRRYNPAMRLILLFREPVERAWSHWKMEVRRNFDSEPFPWCIREGRKRVRDDPATPGFHRVFSYVERGFYGVQLERLLRLFPRDQLLLLRSEDLKAQPDATVRRVCAFLGVDGPSAPIAGRRDNAAPQDQERGGPPEEDAVFLRNLYADDLGRFEALSGLDLSHWRRR